MNDLEAVITRFSSRTTESDQPVGVAFNANGAHYLFMDAGLNYVICVDIPRACLCVSQADAEAFFRGKTV